MSFTDLTIGTVEAWTWDFGDGSTSNLQHPVHTYAAPGVYTVTLIVRGLFGFGVEVKTDYFTVF